MKIVETRCGNILESSPPLSGGAAERLVRGSIDCVNQTIRDDGRAKGKFAWSVGRRPACVLFVDISQFPERHEARPCISLLLWIARAREPAARDVIRWSLSLSLSLPSGGMRRISFFLKSFRSWLDSDVLVLTRYRVQTTLEPQTFSRSIWRVYTGQTGENKKWFSNHESALCHARSGLKFNRRTRNTARRSPPSMFAGCFAFKSSFNSNKRYYELRTDATCYSSMTSIETGPDDL